MVCWCYLVGEVGVGGCCVVLGSGWGVGVVVGVGVYLVGTMWVVVRAGVMRARVGVW